MFEDSDQMTTITSEMMIVPNFSVLNASKQHYPSKALTIITSTWLSKQLTAQMNMMRMKFNLATLKKKWLKNSTQPLHQV